MKDGIANALGAWYVILRFGYMILCIGAMFAGLEDWLGLPGWASLIIGIIVINIFPTLGAILGLMGAIKGWNWEWYWAVLLFFPGIVFYILVMGGGLIGSLFSRQNKEDY